MLRLSHVNSDGVKVVDEYVLRLASVLSPKSERESLWFRAKFEDLDAKKEAKRHDVSIQLQPSLVDGQAVEYKPGIEHIALTGRPVIPNLGPWIDDAYNPLVMTKEVLYPGDFFKKVENLSFSATDRYLDKVIKSGNEQITNRVNIPVQLGHDGDGKVKGTVTQFFKGKRFYADRATQALSFYKPSRPLTFFALALSLDAVGAKVNSMEPITLDELLGLLELTAPEGADDAAKQALVSEALKEFLQYKASKAAPADAGAGGDAEAELSQNGGGAKPRLAEALLAPRKVAMTVSLSQIQQTQANNSALLDSYVNSRQITPAQKSKLLDDFNDNETVKLSILSTSAKSPLLKALESAVGNQSNGWQSNGRTPVGADAAKKLALSQSGNVNPMLAERESRQQI